MIASFHKLLQAKRDLWVASKFMLLVVAAGSLVACVDEGRFEPMTEEPAATGSTQSVDVEATDDAATREVVSDEDDVNDPLEGVNRVIFEVNRTLDETLLKPMAIIYRGVVPEFGRERIDNVLFNLTEPVNFVNALLQGKFELAGDTAARFLLNSTVGFFGAFDVADQGAGLPRHKEDFGQTLGVWGLGEGPYLMLPLFGPSNPRDATGLIVDFFIDPWGYVFPDEVELARFGTSAVNERSKFIDALDSLEQSTVDFYAALRNLYRQQREAAIRDSEAPTQTFEIPDYDDDDF